MEGGGDICALHKVSETYRKTLFPSPGEDGGGVFLLLDLCKEGFLF